MTPPSQTFTSEVGVAAQVMTKADSKSDSKILTRLIGTLRALLLWPLIVYCSWLAGQFSWWVVWKDPFIVQLNAPASGPAGAVAVPAVSVASLDLFGKVGANAQVPAEITREAPQTRLSLQLHGVVLGQRAEDSGAIVSGNREEALYYKIGEALPGGAELAAVESDRVLIRRAGILESLAFEERLDAGVSVAATSPQINTPEDFLNEATQRLQADAVSALASFGLQPTQGGYVFDGANPMLGALNLRQGDVVSSVNGHALGDVEQDRQLVQQWYEAGQITVDVERGGTRFTVTVPFR